MITEQGLREQLLGTVVAHERPDLQEKKEQLIIESAKNRDDLYTIESKILELCGLQIIVSKNFLQRSHAPDNRHAENLNFGSRTTQNTFRQESIPKHNKPKKADILNIVTYPKFVLYLVSLLNFSTVLRLSTLSGCQEGEGDMVGHHKQIVQHKLMT
uniref:Dynein heavy chain ATP-binding dynein motor region domain-containing protein n=1 Tax=Glossina pallidipes TaxID=7398 RepID=A0A1A9ZUF5_GLOPL